MGYAVKRIVVLTSGGDSPGMNAAVRAVVRTADLLGIDCIGIRRGYNGLINGDFVKLDADSVSHIINRGGTILYTARSDEFPTEEGQQKAVATCKLLGLDGIVAIGGDGTFLSAAPLAITSGLPIIGVNFGRLGFLAQTNAELLPRALQSGEYSLQERSLLEVRLDCPLPEGFFPYALNEVSVSRVSASMLGVDVQVDGAALPTYWADGLLVATSTGSTVSPATFLIAWCKAQVCSAEP